MNLPQITFRERIALIAGALFVAVTLVVLGVVLPYRSALARLDARVASRQRQVEQVQELRQEYQRLQRQLADAEARIDQARDFSLFSFVEAAVGRTAGKENLVYMRPQAGSSQEGIREETVEIKLEKLRLDQLVRFLYLVESSPSALQVKTLRVRSRFDDRTRLDAVMTISLYGRSA